MNRLIEIIRNLFFRKNDNRLIPSKFEIETQIQLIKQIELNHKIEPGRRIHTFEFQEFELGLDLEVTGTYRLVVYEKREKRYSFSIRCLPGEYEELARGIRVAIDYLSGERKIFNLPKDELIKGYYFGA